MAAIFDLDDYRIFLDKWIKSQPQRGRGQQVRFAEAAQVQAPFVSQVLARKANFSVEQGYGIANYINLSKDEIDYLKLSIEYQRAGQPAYKSHLKKQMQELREQSKKIEKQLQPLKAPSALDTQKYFSTWLYPAIHLLCLIEDFSKPSHLAQRLSLPEIRIKEALEFLLSTGLIELTEGRYQSTAVRLHAPKGSPQLMAYQLACRNRAMQKISEKSEDIHFTSVHSVSLEDFEKIQREILGLIKKADEIVKDSEAKDVFSLNIDYFKL